MIGPILGMARPECPTTHPVSDTVRYSFKMGRKSKGWDGKIYKQPTPGAGWEPGTVDYGLRQRRIRAQNRREDRAFKKMQEQREAMEVKGFWRAWDAIVNFFKTPRW